ncbi:HET-domain-containing protein, partial [Stipitochalara longipes BDJ]
MSSQNSSILYSPLEDDEIRLLVLVPGSGSKSIHCRLATVKLQTQAEVPVYEALSYMWGPPSPSTLIYVNDTPFEVRNNLFEALKQLPYEYFPRCLWVDAICINQKDNSERGHQVAIMSSVFRAATKVLVWLGGARDNSDMAFEALASVHGHLGMLHSIAKSWIMAGVDVTRYNSNQVETALLSICRRPYWSRVWIIQEILSA